MKADFWNDLLAADEEVEALELWLAETSSQFAAEEAMFGDGWAGGRLDIEAAEERLAEAHGRYRRLLAMV